jgi:hypothetical protein
MSKWNKYKDQQKQRIKDTVPNEERTTVITILKPETTCHNSKHGRHNPKRDHPNLRK